MAAAPLPIGLRVMGGLGNQLFQLAVAIHLRDVVGVPVVLDRQFYADDWPDMDNRDLEIEALPHGFTMIRGRSMQRMSRIRNLPRTVQRRLTTRGARSVLFNDAVAEARAVTDPSPKALALIALSENEPPFFQSAGPPLANAEVMRSLLEGRIPLAFQPVVDAPYVAVHSRLGDYLNDRWRAELGPTDPASLLALGRQLSQRHGGLPVRVFTDSPGLFTQLCPNSPTDPYELSDAVTSWDVLTGLARASALVMSNSTLSWWAAFIATWYRTEPVEILMPHPWYAAPSSADDLLPLPGWTRFERALLDDSVVRTPEP